MKDIKVRAMAMGMQKGEITRRDFYEVGPIELDDYVTSHRTLLIHMIDYLIGKHNDRVS